MPDYERGKEPQDVLYLTVGWGNHTLIFVDRRHFDDLFTGQVLTLSRHSLSAPALVVMSASKARFWHALAVGQKRKRRRLDNQVESVANLLPEKVQFFSPKDEAVRLRTARQPTAFAAKRIAWAQSTIYWAKVSRSSLAKKAFTAAVAPIVSSNQSIGLTTPSSETMRDLQPLD